MKNCAFCKKNITLKYMKVSSYVFHPECFCCSYCNQKIEAHFNEKNGKFYHLDCYKKSFNLVCTHCKNFLGDKYINHEGKKYHEPCYIQNYAPKCNICDKPIEGQYTYDAEGKYHYNCFKNTKLDVCNVCTLPIEGRYIKDHWGNLSHDAHSGYKTITCDSCSRIISHKTSNGGIQYSDGRNVCGICQITEITSDEQINQSKQRIITQLIEVGFDYIPNYINVSLSDKKTLHKRLGVSLKENSHGYTKTVIKRENNKRVYMENSIFILYGLPRLKFESILAHELLHVWLNERDIKMSSKDTEGFCNLGAALIYQNDKTPNGEYYLKRMLEDPDTIYGDGYRKMSKRLQNIGWKALINEVLNSNNSVINKLSIFKEKFF